MVVPTPLEMDLGLGLQMVAGPVAGSGDWDCMTLTIMGTESHLWNVVTSTPNKPAPQDGGGNT